MANLPLLTNQTFILIFILSSSLEQGKKVHYREIPVVRVLVGLISGGKGWGGGGGGLEAEKKNEKTFGNKLITGDTFLFYFYFFYFHLFFFFNFKTKFETLALTEGLNGV